MPLGTTNLEVEFQLCWLFSSSWDAPECTASWPSLKQPGPGEANRCPPSGPYQYCAVHQYSVVRRVWGASGVAGFLIFAPPTPPQDLIAGILSTHVRCLASNSRMRCGDQKRPGPIPPRGHCGSATRTAAARRSPASRRPRGFLQHAGPHSDRGILRGR